MNIKKNYIKYSRKKKITQHNLLKNKIFIINIYIFNFLIKHCLVNMLGCQTTLTIKEGRNKKTISFHLTVVRKRCTHHRPQHKTRRLLNSGRGAQENQIKVYLTQRLVPYKPTPTSSKGVGHTTSQKQKKGHTFFFPSK